MGDAFLQPAEVDVIVNFESRGQEVVQRVKAKLEVRVHGCHLCGTRFGVQPLAFAFIRSGNALSCLLGSLRLSQQLLVVPVGRSLSLPLGTHLSCMRPLHLLEDSHVCPKG
ncbi:hypothetical protein [Micromonospora lutea]|uniref:hypothetical protein n=1 Tax=Micromonospora lutea TaxID=419825 RepID=UPI0019513D3A|nr:hypothetical protein [Micromonospora lutea]